MSPRRRARAATRRKTIEARPGGRSDRFGPGALPYLYMLAILLTNSLYLWHWRYPGTSFGFHQLHHLPGGLVLGAYLTIVMIAVAVNQRRRLAHLFARLDLPELVPRLRIPLFLLVAVFSIAVFYPLRSHYLNPDGLRFEEKFQRDVPSIGAHVVHDEMWELYVHSKFWQWTHDRWGWSVPQSYGVLSSIAGGIFVFLLLVLAYDLERRHFVPFVGFAIAAAYMQLYFGDVENYTLVGVLILSYLYASWLFLRGRLSVVVPIVVLAVAVTFHLLAGWLIPGALHLGLVAIRREQLKGVLIGAGLGVLICGCTLLFLHFNGLPLHHLIDQSNLFGRGHGITFMLVRPDPVYYYWIGQLLFLLFPLLPVLLILLVTRSVEWSPLNRFLGISGLSMLVFMFTWRAMIGIYQDWNLFANSAFVLSIFTAYNFVRQEDLRFRWELFVLLVGPALLHSLAWISFNHRGGISP